MNKVYILVKYSKQQRIQRSIVGKAGRLSASWTPASAGVSHFRNAERIDWPLVDKLELALDCRVSLRPGPQEEL